ncbi:hypothetical protein FACS189454_04120 [Planctomycetales bacterium]|nr:hypothetical protein FACS189454_04120 [Planctomycetales bacterium]
MAADLPDGADLYINAVRFRCANHTLVHSLSYATEQVYRIPTKSTEEIEAIASKMEEEHRIALKDNPNAHLWIDGLRESVRQHYMQGEIRSRFEVKYKALNFSRSLFSLQIERQDKATSKWELETCVIENNIVSKKIESEGAVWLPQGRSAHVSNTQSYTESFINFGRIQGKAIALVEFLFFQDADVEKYEFSKKNVEKFKDARSKQMQSGTARTLQTIGTVKYEGSSEAFVVESSVGNKVVERYWIDAARGYICPLAQCYDDKNGKLLSEYKSSDYFLHEKSGLWFPATYSEITLDNSNKEQHKEYHIDVSSLNVNFQVNSEEFAISLPESVEVIDERGGKDTVYKTLSSGTLSLGKGGLDLTDKDWLFPVGTLVKKTSSVQIYIRAFLVLVGILLIARGIYSYFRKKS